MSTASDFDFIAANDLHYRDAECDAWFSTVFAAMRESAPAAAFVLLAGDLADQGRPEQLEGFHQLLPKLGLPCHVVPGNHDWTTSSIRSTYEKLFPGSLNYTFHHSGWQFIGLNTTDGDRWHDTIIPEVTLQWLETTLPGLDKNKPTVVFTHFPLGENIVLPPQNSESGEEPAVYNFRPLNAPRLLSMLSGHNLQAILSGHFHSYTERTFGNAQLTTNKCCSRVQKNHDGTREKGWFVCEARNGRLTRRFVEIPVALRE